MRLRATSAALIAGREHYDTVIQAIARAELSVWIATADVKSLMVEDAGRKRYRSMLAVLDGLAQRGVELRLLHAKLPSRAFREEFDRHPRLVSGGLQLRMCPRNHMKLVIVDAHLLYLGSANWTGAGLGVRGDSRRNFELGIVTDDEVMLDQVQALYEKLWRGGHCKRCGLRPVCESPLDLERTAR
jgi:phosphatidylserine/phosphatidylglycerophosphate/cardiolipin synthase-like enzyme